MRHTPAKSPTNVPAATPDDLRKLLRLCIVEIHFSADWLGAEDHSRLIADEGEPAGIDHVLDHEPVALLGDVEGQLPSGQDIVLRIQRDTPDSIVRGFSHLRGEWRASELHVAQ